MWCIHLYAFDQFVDFFQNQFVVDDVSKIIKEAIENTIGGNAYQHDKVNQWTSAVVENCLSVLTKLQKPYKYIGMSISRQYKWCGQLLWWLMSLQFFLLSTVNSTIMQKNGAGLHTASSCFWNNDTDGSCTVSMPDTFFFFVTFSLNAWQFLLQVRWENKTMYCIVSVYGLAI